MLTVHDRSGRTFIFMDFFPCKAKDLPAKMAKLTATVEKYRNDLYLSNSLKDEIEHKKRALSDTAKSSQKNTFTNTD